MGFLHEFPRQSIAYEPICPGPSGVAPPVDVLDTRRCLVATREGNVTRATLLHPEDYRVMKWRNGQGTTTEIAVAPGRDGRFRWRLSIADVAAAGPVWDFPGDA